YPFYEISCIKTSHMSNKKRLEYLESQWERYPALDVKPLTVREMHAEFSKLTTGVTPKSDYFYLGGRISRFIKSALSEQVEQFFLSTGGEEFFLKTNLLGSYNELVQNILSENDQVLVRIEWQHVYTSGLFPKIENMSPTEIKLLAPAKATPLEASMSLKRAKQREFFLDLVRKCFAFLEFTEVRTPTLVSSPGLEPFIDVFSTEFSVGKQKQTLYLPTSPEFSLKKVLSLGHDRIFEMKSSFRNGEVSE